MACQNEDLGPHWISLFIFPSSVHLIIPHETKKTRNYIHTHETPSRLELKSQAFGEPIPTKSRDPLGNRKPPLISPQNPPGPASKFPQEGGGLHKPVANLKRWGVFFYNFTPCCFTGKQEGTTTSMFFVGFQGDQKRKPRNPFGEGACPT